MKKVLYGFFIFALAFLLVGCGGKKTKEETFKSHNKNDNAVECSAKQGKNVGTVYVYFDSNNKITSFDFYMEYDAEDATEDDIKKAEELVCNGEGEFKKEWLDECSYDLEDGMVKAHVYVNNGEWFGEYQTKEEIKNMNSGELSGYTCVDKN